MEARWLGPLLAGSGPPICAPQHDLNDRIVGQADLDFRPEADTDGIVRCTVDYQSQNPDNHILSHQGSIDRFPNDNYDGFH